MASSRSSRAASGRLAVVFGIGVCLYSVPLVVVGLFPSVLSALLALALIGLGNSLVDVNALTIMQRLVPDEVLGRAARSPRRACSSARSGSAPSWHRR